MKKIVKLCSVITALVLIISSLAACESSKKSEDKGTVKEETSAVKVIDVKLTDEDYAFGVDKDQPELLETVNKVVDEIKENGKLDELCEKYYGGGTPAVIKSAKLDSSKDQLVVATNAAFEPFEYTDGDGYSGVDMEIAQILADELGQELVIQNMDFDAVCLSVGQHKCDIAMAGLTINEERKEYVEFSNSYYKASQKLIVKGDDTKFDDCKTVEEVEALLNELEASSKIGVQNGTTGQFYVEGDEGWGFTGFKVECVGYKNGSLAVQDLVNGGLDYVIIDEAPADFISKAINEMN